MQNAPRAKSLKRTKKRLLTRSRLPARTKKRLRGAPKKKAPVRRRIKKNRDISQRSIWLSRASLVIGIILFTLWGTRTLLAFRAIRLSDMPLYGTSVTANIVAQPTGIVIGKTIRLPVTLGGYINGTWLVSSTHASYIGQSALPGTPGNIIIYAHNKPNLFGPLQKLKGSEEITLTTRDGITHRYRVTNISVVKTQDTRLLQPTRTETLTLYTCTGFLDSKRLVVRAEPR